MTYQVLARKWRPRRFDDMVGQAHIVRTLRNALDGDRLHHAYLFTGTRGVGKTTVARILAKALNCERGVSSTPCGECGSCNEIDTGRSVDLIEVDAASRTRVDETRELMDNVPYAPTAARFKVYLIDEVHMFSNHSFNALLKTLEEPPPHVKFLLATTDPKRLPITVISRCLQLNLNRVPAAEIAAHLTRILEAEQVPAEAQALMSIAAAADGSVRDALSLLDQAIAFGAGSVQSADVNAMLGTVSGTDIHAIIDAIAERHGERLLLLARRLADGNPDYARVLGEMLSYLRRIAVVQALGTAGHALEDDGNVLELAARISPEDCQLFYQIGLLGSRDLPLAPDPQVGLEMVLLRMLAFSPAGQSVTAPSPKPPPQRKAAPSAAASRPAAHAAPSDLPADAHAALTADNWPAVIDALGLTALVRELAQNCAPLDFHDNVLRLALDPKVERLHNQKLERRLEEVLQQRFGADLALRIETAGAASGATPSARHAAAEQARQRQAELAIDADETVRALKETFNASVEDVSPR